MRIRGVVAVFYGLGIVFIVGRYCAHEHERKHGRFE
jgi:hypothetical protein